MFLKSHSNHVTCTEKSQRYLKQLVNNIILDIIVNEIAIDIAATSLYGSKYDLYSVLSATNPLLCYKRYLSALFTATNKAIRITLKLKIFVKS